MPQLLQQLAHDDKYFEWYLSEKSLSICCWAVVETKLHNTQSFIGLELSNKMCWNTLYA